MRFKLYPLLWLFIVFCTHCDFDNINYKSIREIIYHYKDASVPPQYHRSYIIILNHESVRVIVDSYKDILMDVKYKSTSEKFDGILLSIEKNEIRKCRPPNFPHSCTGGHTESVEFGNENYEIFFGSVYHCASKNSEDICGNLPNLVRDIKS